VLSIAYAQPLAVLDGNVARVLARIGAVRGDLRTPAVWRELESTAQDLLAPQAPGDWNQAMMELGAVVCTPRAPVCLMCPVVELCATRGEIAGGAKAARQKKREIHYALDYRGSDYRSGAVFLVQRPQDARLMAGMWELPEIPAGAKARSNGADKIAALKALRHPKATRRETNDACFTLKHSITVTNYSVRVWRTSAPKSVRGEWVAVERLARVALTGLARKILRKAEIIAGDDRQV
jgi:A/G-specific adenine glycosylase